MSRGQYGRGFQEGKKIAEKAAEELLKSEKGKKIATAAGASILGLIAGVIFKGLSK